MDILTLARFQFAMTTIFHFLFVPLSIGLGLLVAIMETLYVVKKKDVYKDMAKFWGKIFLLSFAVGVVTGIIQEFQFGMNWSDYSRFVGDIFGAPLAVEALLAFFMESTFIGLWAFGWDKFSKKLHLTFMWLVAFGSTLSAFWILAANAFMQHPQGFRVNEVTGRAELTSFGALLTNEQLWYEFSHVIFAAFTTGGFIVAGLSAWQLLKRKQPDFYTRSMKLGLIVGLISVLGAIGAGDLQMRALIEEQPMKFAAMEAIYEDTPNPAPFTVVADIDTKEKEVKWDLEIPYMLSILGHHKLSGGFEGMDSVNEQFHEKYDAKFGEDMNYYLPVKTLFWGFRFMVGFGMLLSLIAIVALFLQHKGKLIKTKWMLWIVGVSLFLPFISNICGWLITELGRYPWTVYGVFTIADSVSPNVTAGNLLFSNIVYFLLFASLGAVLVYLIRLEMKKGPYPKQLETADVTDPFAKEAF